LDRSDVAPTRVGLRRLWSSGGPYDALGRRVVAAFVLVALAAVLVVALVEVTGAHSGLTRLSRSARQQLTDEVAIAAADAYSVRGTWAGADLRAVAEIGYAEGLRITIADASGALLTGPEPTSGHLSGAAQATRPVNYHGSRIGTVHVWFSRVADHVTDDAHRLVIEWVVIGGAVAMAVAVVAGTFVSHRLTRPLRRITEAAVRFARGEHDARAGGRGAPGALGSLAVAVDEMADTVVADADARARFVSDVRHELATPAAALQAGLEELRDGLLEPTPARLAGLHDQSVRLGRMISDLTAIDRDGPPRMTVEPGVLDLRSVVGEALDAKEPVLRAAGVGVERRLASVKVCGDRDRLVTVVDHLIDNAVRHAGPGVTLSVVTAARADRAQLVVCDNGRGIDAEDLAHVFERAYRGRRAAAVPGSGLGLALVRQLVESHGGEVSIESAPGSGTSVTVSLPLLTADAGRC
jgi:two-component system sensor histidine kinase BaeS